MRLIDADRLTDICKQIADNDWNKRAAPNSWADAYESFIYGLEDSKTVDAVEVCRCKYCKHRTLAGKAPFMFFLCSHNNGLRENVKDNDFCSYGERKEG